MVLGDLRQAVAGLDGIGRGRGAASGGRLRGCATRGGARNEEFIPGLDEIRIGDLSLIGLPDFLPGQVVAGGDAGQGVAGLHHVGAA